MYDKYPYISISDESDAYCTGWEAVGRFLCEFLGGRRRVVCVECYPGVFVKDVCLELARALEPALTISTEEMLLPSVELHRRFAPMLTDDPVFGTINGVEIETTWIWKKCGLRACSLREYGKGEC